MALTITFKIHSEPEPIVAKIMADAKKVGVQFQGDSWSVSFSGCSAKGTYSLEGDLIQLTVLDKPFFLSDSAIRKMAVENASAWGLSVV